MPVNTKILIEQLEGLTSSIEKALSADDWEQIEILQKQRLSVLEKLANSDMASLNLEDSDRLRSQSIKDKSLKSEIQKKFENLKGQLHNERYSHRAIKAYNKK